LSAKQSVVYFGLGIVYKIVWFAVNAEHFLQTAFIRRGKFKYMLFY